MALYILLNSLFSCTALSSTEGQYIDLGNYEENCR